MPSAFHGWRWDLAAAKNSTRDFWPAALRFISLRARLRSLLRSARWRLETSKLPIVQSQEGAHCIAQSEPAARRVGRAAWGNGVSLVDDLLGLFFGNGAAHPFGGHHERAGGVFAVRIVPLPCDEEDAEVVAVGNVDMPCKTRNRPEMNRLMQRA